jgi:hypothetical protein
MSVLAWFGKSVRDGHMHADAGFLVVPHNIE